MEAKPLECLHKIIMVKLSLCFYIFTKKKKLVAECCNLKTKHADKEHCNKNFSITEK